MKDKLKNYFNKDRIFVFICLLCIIAFCVLYAILYTNDKKHVSEHQSTIILNEDDKNLNTSWIINNDGNLVGNNIINPNVNSATLNGVTINNNNGVFSVSGVATRNFEFNISNEIYNYLPFGLYYLSGNEYLTFNYIDNNNGYIASSGANRVIDIFDNHKLGSIYFYFQNGVSYNFVVSPMLNKGDIPLDWEPFGVWYNEINYDNVNNQLQLQSEINKYGWLSYIDNVLLKINNNNSTSYEFTLDQLKTNNYIGADSSFNLYTLASYNNPNYYSASIDIYFANSILNSDELPINLFNVSTKEGFNGTITLRDSDSQVVVLNVQGASSITYLDIIEANSEFSNSIYNVTFDFVSPDSATLIFANSNYSLGFQSGFNKGYNNAYNSLSKTINDLTIENNTISSELDTLNTSYDTLESNYNTLLYQYNNLTTDKYTFTELFWSISAVPFGILTSGFNVNVLGFNLAAVITGLFTSLLLIWLIKKFFK